MKEKLFTIISNEHLSADICRLKLAGDVSEIKKPGQFVNIQIDGMFLRRPLSVCDSCDDTLTVMYKINGKGTEKMSHMTQGTFLSVLTGLGNGYDTTLSGDHPLLIGGGTGVSPMYKLAKTLIAEGKDVTVILGFNTESEIVLEEDFIRLGCHVIVTTVDGTYGVKGFVTDAMPENYTYFYTCGPEAMFKAIYAKSITSGEFSFEARMGCGFGACMGCTCKTITGYKRICKDGPVLKKEEILWAD